MRILRFSLTRQNLKVQVTAIPTTQNAALDAIAMVYLGESDTGQRYYKCHISREDKASPWKAAYWSPDRRDAAYSVDQGQ